KVHELQLVSVGQNFSLTVDRGYTRHINNRGQNAYLNTSDIRALYIAGLPNDLTARALQLWHIREATSFQGCIHALYINDDPVNFANVDYRHKILPGCENHEHNQLSCTSATCQYGQCRLQGLDYKCTCHEGYTGLSCSQPVQTSIALPLISSCDLTVEKGFYVDPLTKCTSNRRLRITRCSGSCPSRSNGTQASCCKPVEPKRRFFQLEKNVSVLVHHLILFSRPFPVPNKYPVTTAPRGRPIISPTVAPTPFATVTSNSTIVFGKSTLNAPAQMSAGGLFISLLKI
ncbi:unnamed protein product, partial [Rotaria socialis]